MYNFQWKVPTNLLFGRNQIENLPNAMDGIGKRILLAYGGGSIKKNGLYDKIQELLSEYEIYELSGIAPNPKISSVREGVRICREKRIDAIVACGGGSVIDASKVIAAGTKYDGDPWDIVKNRRLITTALPVIAISTMAASGSEMDRSAVITNDETKEKLTMASPYIYPQISVCDPTYLYTVSSEHTAAGVADIFSHAMEMYFNETMGAFVADRMAEAIMITCVHHGKTVIEQPDDYEARANIMWAGTWAANGMLQWGRGSVVMPCHVIEHELGAFYDITHGTGLAILMPTWMRYTLNDKTLAQYSTFGQTVWGCTGASEMESAQEGIDKLETFLKSLGLPQKLSEVGICDDDMFDEMSKRAVVNGNLMNAFVKLDADDVRKILEMCR